MVITDLKIGTKSWIDAGIDFSDEFILGLISRTPKMIKLEIFSSQTIEEMKRKIDEGGRELEKLIVSGTNGEECFFLDSDEAYSYSDDSSDFDSDWRSLQLKL